MTTRIDAAAKFVMDAFVVTFIAIILTDELWHLLLLFWPVICIAAALSALLLFKKSSYKIWQAVAIAFVSAGAGLLIGYSWWLAGALMLASIYRIHARFLENEDEAGSTGTPLLWIVVLFLIALFTAMFNPQQETEQILYLLFISAAVLNVLFSFGNRYLRHRSEGIVWFHVLAAAAFVVASSGFAALFVYGIAQSARQGVGTAAGWLLHLALWPFSGLMEKLGALLEDLSRSEEAQETFDKLGPEETTAESELIEFQAAGDFPVEAMLTILLLAIAIILVLWLKKRHPENTAMAKEHSVTIERAAIINIESAAEGTLQNRLYTKEMDLHHIREVYREFELKAEINGFGRASSETVREWMMRMDWVVSEKFFTTYELVRYGQGAVSASEANPFLGEIERLTEKNFSKEV